MAYDQNALPTTVAEAEELVAYGAQEIERAERKLRKAEAYLALVKRIHAVEVAHLFVLQETAR